MTTFLRWTVHNFILTPYLTLRFAKGELTNALYLHHVEVSKGYAPFVCAPSNRFLRGDRIGSEQTMSVRKWEEIQELLLATMISHAHTKFDRDARIWVWFIVSITAWTRAFGRLDQTNRSSAFHNRTNR